MVAVPERIACKPLVREVNRAGGCWRVTKWFPKRTGLGAFSRGACRATGVLSIPWRNTARHWAENNIGRRHFGSVRICRLQREGRRSNTTQGNAVLYGTHRIPEYIDSQRLPPGHDGHHPSACHRADVIRRISSVIRYRIVIHAVGAG